MSSRNERPAKKMRRVSTDSDGSEDLDMGRLGGRRAVTPVQRESQRSRRADNASATVSRGPAPPTSQSPQSMKLTVKASSNKLREATRAATGNASKAAAPKDPFIGGQVLEGKRSRNVTKSYVMESDSEEDVEMDDVVDDEDAEGESIDEDEDEDAEDDGLGDEDAEGDIEMDIPPPPPPVIKISKAQSGKQSIVVKPPPKVDNKTVEQKEVEDGSDDEELSDLSDLEEDDVEEEEAMQSDNEEDAEGEDEDIEDVEDGDEPLDSDDETPMDGSRASTPDLSKLTRRQRAKFEEDTVHLMALPDEVQVKKHFTAEEHAMRRAEMARRRKNLSEKRNEEEKMETINKLLKKQAPKTNARRKEFNIIPGEPTPDVEAVKPDAAFVRWVSNKDGNVIGVPEEWLDTPVGSIFSNSVKSAGGAPPAAGVGNGKLVQEVS